MDARNPSSHARRDDRARLGDLRRTAPVGDHAGMVGEGGERPRFLIVEGVARALDREAGRSAAAGAEVVDGFRQPVRTVRQIVRRGTVASPTDAADALLAALDGAGLLVHATADRTTIDRLVDDLRRLGPVEHRIVEGDDEPDVPEEARALLGLLAEGHSLGEAAAILGLARRTADRRLAEARRALGTERTTEAIARANRLGWLGGSRRDDN